MADDPREPFDPQADAIAGRRVADLLEHIPATVFILTNEVPPRLLYVNGQVERLTGYSRQAWLEDPDLWMRSMHPADQERVMDRWAESVRAASSFLCEYRIVRPDGTVASVREATDPVRNLDGGVVCWQGVTHDITDRQAAEEALTRSEARYRALVERLPAVVYVDSDEVDPLSLYVSPNSEEVLGYAPSRYLEDPGLWYATIHPDDLTNVKQAWAGVIESRDPFTLEYRMVRPDGGSLWVRDSSIPIMDEVGDTLFWQGVMLDITAQKLAEEDLRRSETRYRVLVEQVPATVYICTDEERPRTLFTSPHSHDQDEVAYGEDERATRWISTIHDDQREEVIGAWVEAVRTGSDFDHEYRRTHLGAEETTWVRDICRLVRDEAGQPMFRQGVILDITRAKKAEHDLRESERRYRALVEQVPAVVYEMGPDDERRTTFVSPHVEDILGYSRQEWLDQPDIWTELLHPDDREIELAAHDLHNETGEPWRREYRLIANDGRIVWVRDQAVLVEDPVTIDARWQGVMLDITAEKDREQSLQAANDDLEWRVLARTAELEDAAEMMSLEIGERRRVEAELREAETRYRMLVEDLPAVVYSWEMNWLDGDPLPEEHAAYTSPAIADMLGFTADEWMRPGFWRQRVHPHDRDRLDVEADRCIASGVPLNLEYRYLAKDGGVVWVWDRATLRSRDERGRPRLFQGVLLDITARKGAETKASEAEAWFKRLTEENPGIMWVVSDRDPDPAVRWRHYYVSPRSLEQSGYPPEAFSARPEGWFAFLHPDDRARVVAETEDIWRTGEPWSSDFRFIHADGRVIWFHVEGRAVGFGEDGLPIGYQGVILDIDDRKREEERLRRSAEQALGVLDGMPALPWTEVIDPLTGASRYEFMGVQSSEMLGYTPEELIAEPRHFERMLHPDDRAHAIRVTDRSDRTGEPWNLVFRVIRRDGEVRWLHGMAKVVSDPDEPLQRWQGVTFDVTSQMEPSAPTASRAREGTDATPSASAPNRPAAGDSPTTR
jgi:adenylate cyclase